MSLLVVEDLSAEFVGRDKFSRPRIAKALNSVSFSVGPREILGLIGETGAGKSLTMSLVMGLIPEGAAITGGRIAFEGRSLLGLDAASLNAMRGDAMTVIVQSPLSALDPLCRLGDQLVRVQRAHRKIGVRAAAAAAQDMLRRLGIPEPARRMKAWPHEISGGMAQRVLIAMALLNEPRLLIADEPTTGLDTTVQVQILEELRTAVSGREMGVVLVTHDLGVVANYCDRVAVMFAGTVVESGPVEVIFSAPKHPYAQALVAAAGGAKANPGTPPDLYDLPLGCLYADRCPRASEICENRPPARELGPLHLVACHHAA